MPEILRHIIVSALKRLRGHIRPCHGNLDEEYVFFFNLFFTRRTRKWTTTRRAIEDLPVVSSVRFHAGDKTHKSGVYANLRCGCGAKQVGPIRMSSKFPTLRDCLRELGRRIEQDHDPTCVAVAQKLQAAEKDAADASTKRSHDEGAASLNANQVLMLHSRLKDHTGKRCASE